MLNKLIEILSKYKFDLSTEANLQLQIATVLSRCEIPFKREFILDKKNRPDFFINGVVVEAKIKGNAKSIYKQCERYTSFPEVEQLILVTNKSIGFPKSINGKSCYVLNLGKAWL